MQLPLGRPNTLVLQDQLQFAFNLFDADGSGSISKDEVELLLVTLSRAACRVRIVSSPLRDDEVQHRNTTLQHSSPTKGHSLILRCQRWWAPSFGAWYTRPTSFVKAMIVRYAVAAPTLSPAVLSHHYATVTITGPGRRSKE